jgi:hypothetical protein
VSGTELVTSADAADPLRIVQVAPPYFDIRPRATGAARPWSPALKVLRVIERIATTGRADIVRDHTFAGPRSTAVSASRQAKLRQILQERSNVAEPTPA